MQDQETQEEIPSLETIIEKSQNQIKAGNFKELIHILLEAQQEKNPDQVDQDLFIHLVDYDEVSVNAVHTFPKTEKGNNSLLRRAKLLIEEHFQETEEHEEEIQEVPNKAGHDAFEKFQEHGTWISPTFTISRF